MEVNHQTLNLDFNNFSHSNLNAHQGDNKTRFIDISFNDFSLKENQTAIIKASINGITKAVNQCTIDTENNKVIAELTDTMLDTTGMLYCEISIIENDEILTSQLFTVNVTRSVINDKEITKSQEYGYLTKLIEENAEIEENAKFINDIVKNFRNVTDVQEILTKVNTYAEEISSLQEETESLNNSKADKGQLPDYATSQTAGLVRGENGFNIDSNNRGAVWCQTYNQDSFSQISNYAFVSKGTLNNVLSPIYDILDSKENSSNKTDEINMPSSIFYPSNRGVWYFVKNITDPLEDYMSMLIPSAVKTVEGKNLINLSDSAEGSLIKIEGENYIIKNKNIYVYSKSSREADNTETAINNTSCTSVVDEGYKITITGTTPYLGRASKVGESWNDSSLNLYRLQGELIPVKENTKISIFCDKCSRYYISAFNKDKVCIGRNAYNKSVIDYSEYNIYDEDIAYITLRFDFDGRTTVGDTFNLKVQIEVGNNTEYEEPKIRETGNLTTFEGGTNIICENQITAKYIPKLY